MPASFEFARTQITHDPNLRIDQTLPKLGSFNLIDFAEEILNIIIEHLEEIPILGDVVKVLKELLDVDGNGHLELDDLIGLFTGRGIIDAIMNGLGFAGAGFSLGALLDAIENLPNWVYNAIKGLITSVLDLGWLRITPNMIFGGDSDNMLLASDFKAAESMEVGDGWFWDATVGRSALGSAKATASGNRLVQMSNLVRVEAAQKLDVSGWVKWSGVSASGAAFKMEAQFYNAGVAGVTLPVGAISSPAASGGWQQVASQVTVPSGVDSMRVRISVEAAVTAGSVWWDDVECKRVGTMPQNFITNLIPDLAGLKDWIESLLNAGLGALGLPALGSIFDKIMDFADGLDDWMTDTDNTASGLDDLLSKLLTNPAAVITSIPQTLISGLASRLAGIDDFVQDLVDAILRAIRGIPIVGGTLADIIAEIGGLNDKAVTAKETADETKAGVVDGWAGAGASTGDVYDTMQAIKTAIESGYTVQTITSSTSWPRPANLTECIVIACGSGQKPTARVGGLGGGFIVQQLDPASIPASVAVTIGSGGTQTSFGSLVVTVPGQGGIGTGLAFAVTASLPGKGGDGGEYQSSGSYGLYGTDGASTPLANGGLAATTGVGGTGQSVSTSVPTKCGGAGGGGGRGGALNSATKGGPGGFPGGGGGAGGADYGNLVGANMGGIGASGVMWVLTKTGA